MFLFLFLEGDPNFQSILNRIIQILHYQWRKQHKNIENSQIAEQNVIFSALLYAYCHLHILHLPQRQSFFSSWTKYSTNLKRHEWLFVLYIVSFSDLKMEFSKLSLAKYHCLHKNAVFTVISIYFTSCLPLLQNVFLNSFSFINSSVQIFLKLN